MNKNIRNLRIIAGIISIAFIPLLFMGCSNNSKNQITIYSLYKSNLIESEIKKYKKGNKDIDIKYEVGIDNPSVTKDDAVKSLNNSLMSGNGPDIVVLDYLNDSTYVNKGMLMDISSIINKKALFDGIVSSYTKANKIYEIPARFGVSAIAGNNVDNITDFNSLIDNVSNQVQDRRIVDTYSEKELIYYFFNTCESSWINEDKSINKDKIQEFLEGCKKIYEINESKITTESKNEHNKIVDKIINASSEDDYYNKFLDGDSYYNYLFNNGPKLSIVNISGVETLVDLESISKSFDNTSYNLWGGQQEKLFVPSTVLSISANSKNKDKAKDIVKYIINKKIKFNDGLPVNKEACKKLLSNAEGNNDENFSNDDGQNIKFNTSSLSNDDINRILNEFNELNNHTVNNTDILKKNIDDMCLYISGKSSINDTMNKIQENLKIWLSE